MIDFTSIMAEQQQPRQLQLANGMEIPRFNQAELEHLILGSKEKEPKDVVLFGEENFTFSIALASLRNNRFQGITATFYKFGPLEQFENKKQQAVGYCTHNGGYGLNGDGSTWGLQLNAEQIEENRQAVSAVPDFSDTWRTGIDATRTPPDLVVAGKVVWFQCPWDYNPDELIQGFMQAMESEHGQRVGDYLLIGIANKRTEYNERHYHYIDDYNLPEILGNDGQGGEVVNGYRFMGGDNELIKKILGRGYKHVGEREIHNFIFDTHVTLVFKRENQAQAQDQDQDQDLPQIAKLKLNEEGGGEGEGGEDKEEEKKKKKKIKK